MKIIVDGGIIEGNCAAKGTLKLTLARPAYTLELHAASYYQVKLVLWRETCRRDSACAVN
jgi:hypothetical protein